MKEFRNNGKLSSWLLASPTGIIGLSSKLNYIALQFLAHKQPPLVTPTPRRLAVIAMAPPKPGGKSKKVVGLIKLAAGAGGREGACRASTGFQGCKHHGLLSFTFILKTPPASVLLLKAFYQCVEKGSKDPKIEKVGKITIEQVRTIAAEMLPDLKCTSIEPAMRIIAGTAANMGIEIDPPVLEPKKEEPV
ncbi:hypothetical protein I3842_11G108100 [Carya illinoinensis]|uniref:Large ribosomal subunit protein uL11 C-terminal domain-containing protein n=1 Tax=Carya illinoinensis TaxID=32201 RepID=A0A922IYY5_CARIL|nr:hypothetical protein I3842_11G108100 [Carya illinoinensis]